MLLGVTTAIAWITGVRKANNKKLFAALFFAISGIAFSFEAGVMFFLNAYSYYPMIFPGDPLEDLVIGNLFSQFSVTSTALLLIVFRKNAWWYILSALIYCGIEWAFLRLGIYVHNWYSTWITFVGFLFIFWIAKVIYDGCLVHVTCFQRILYTFISFYTLYLVTLLWPFKVAGVIDFNMSLLSQDRKSYAFLALLNMALITVPCMFAYYTRARWRWKAVAVAAMVLAVLAECALRLMTIARPWFVLYPAIEISGSYLYVFLLDNLLGGTDTRLTGRGPLVW